MVTLRASPYNLVQGNLVRAKVSATNIRGTGDLADESTEANSVAVITEPLGDAVLSRDSDTNEKRVKVAWQAPSNGGSAITSYNL